MLGLAEGLFVLGEIEGLASGEGVITISIGVVAVGEGIGISFLPLPK